MAKPGYGTEQLDPGDSNAKLSAQSARQGQNVKGMIWVLVIGVALVVIAYTVMLALQAVPSSVVNESANDAASAPVNSQVPSAPSDVQPQQPAPN